VETRACNIRKFLHECLNLALKIFYGVMISCFILGDVPIHRGHNKSMSMLRVFTYLFKTIYCI
jgi:hypothetical protein